MPSIEVPSPQLTEKVAVIAVFGMFVVVLFKYTGVPVTAVVTTLPPDEAS